MPSRPRRSAKAARPEADGIDRAIGAGRRLSLHGRLLRKDARQFVIGVQRTTWLQRDATATRQRMGFPHMRRRLREVEPLLSWFTSAARRERVR